MREKIEEEKKGKNKVLQLNCLIRYLIRNNEYRFRVPNLCHLKTF